MTDDRQWYIDYFTHMEEEDKKYPLGGMAWDDLAYHAGTAIANGLFTKRELKECWPHLWGWIEES